MVAVLEAVARMKDEFSGPADKIQGKTKQTEGAMAGLGKTVAGTAAGFVAAQVSMATVTAALGAAIGSAMRFESQLAQIRALTGATAKDTDFLKGEILDMAKSMPKSPDELGAGAYFILSSGITDAADAANVLEIAAKASTVGLGETEVVADALTTVLNSYQLEAGEAGRVTDVLMQAVKDGKAEADAFSGVLGRVVPIAAQMGISFEEVAANLATFTRLGVSAEEAATGLRGVMTQLLNPSEEARDLMASFGLSIQEVREQIREKGLAATLQELMRMFKGNEEAIATLFPDVRGLTNVLATAGVQADAYTEILGNMETATGNLDEGFAEVSETTEFKVNLAMNRLNVALMELGTVALPAVAEGAEAAAESIAILTDAVDILNEVAGVLAGKNIGEMFVDVIPGSGQLQGSLKLLKGDFKGAADEALRFAPLPGVVEAGIRSAIGAFGGGKTALEELGETTGKTADEWREYDDTIINLRQTQLAASRDMEEEVEPTYTQALANIRDAAKDARDALSDMFKTTTVEELAAETALNALELEAAQLEGRTGTLSGAEQARLDQIKNDLIPQQRNVIDQLRLQKEGVELHAQAQTDALPSMQEWSDAAQLQADKVTFLRIALGELPSTINVKVALGLAQTAELDIINQWLAAGGAGSIVPMAEGGVVTRPTLGLVAESGPEAVIPLTGLQATIPPATGTVIDLEELADILDSRFARLAGSLMVELDGREVGRVILAEAGRQADLFRRAG